MITAVLGLGCWLICTAVVLPPTLRMDNVSYLRLAADPFAFGDVAGIHAQRPLPCWIVYVLTRLSPLSPTAAFRTVSGLSYLAFLALVYISFRIHAGRAVTALTGTLFCAISGWPITYSLSNVYQACDAMAYPLSLSFILASVHRKHRTATVLGILGTLTRQQLFLLAILGHLASWKATGNRRLFGSIAITGVVFTLLITATGQRGAVSLWGHTAGKILNVDDALKALWDTRAIVLISPFAGVLLAYPRMVLQYTLRHWWIAAFVVISTLQPMFAIHITGTSNAVRLAMLGLWPVLWLGARITDRNLTQTWARVLYLLLPLLYGTAHLVSQQAVYPSPLGHRAVCNLLLIAILAAQHLWCRAGARCRSVTHRDRQTRGP